MSDINGIPKDIAESLRKIGRVEWGATEAKPDKGHVQDMKSTLAITRNHFGLTDDRQMQGVYIAGSDIVVCHTGTSPNSAQHARILVGAWNQLLDLVTEAPEEPDTA